MDVQVEDLEVEIKKGIYDGRKQKWDGWTIVRTPSVIC